MSIIFASKYFDNTLTKSHAARLLVSTSLPSISRLIYSSGLSTNNSLSDSVKFSNTNIHIYIYIYNVYQLPLNSMLGIMTFAQILLRVVGSSNKCLYCARSATVAKNCNAFDTSCNNPRLYRYAFAFFFPLKNV